MSKELVIKGVLIALIGAAVIFSLWLVVDLASWMTFNKEVCLESCRQLVANGPLTGCYC